jgi:lysozyme
MKTSKKGIELIKSFEGLRLEAYLCPAGVWTIGYGHTKTAKPGQKITSLEAENLLKQDLVSYEAAVNNENLNINQNQFDALVSFAFNCGVGAFRSSTLLRLVKNNPCDANICNQFAKWVNATNGKLPGLIKRRKMEADLYFAK